MKFENAKMRRKKDLLFYCMLVLMLFKQDTLEVEEKSIVEICSTSIFPYGTYRNGNIYICKLGEEEYYLENTSSNDIVCVDGREQSDANMKIMSSYKITNRQDMEEILRVLERYEYENPSKWNRTIPAMKNEWVVHNACYFLGLQTDRTDDVDLNNEDESLYNLEFITKILGN